MASLRRHLASLQALALLALTFGLVPTARAEGPLTLWLSRPLYPGQDSLVARTETTLRGLFPADAGGEQLVGREALARRFEGRAVSLGCILGEVACADPVDALVAGLGVGRVVLLKVGQDESGYRCRVTTFALDGEPVHAAEGQGAVLEKALLSALVKVVSLNASLAVESVPPGAAIFVDGERVGEAPATLQLLPGEHAVKLELPGHLPVEFKQAITARGSAKVSKSLEKVPARLVVSALPKGTAILVDGVSAGTDKLDRGIQPGTHTVALQLDGYVPYERKLEIDPGGTATVEHTLPPTTWTTVRGAMAEAQDEEAARRLYVQVGYESVNFTSWEFKTQVGQKVSQLVALERTGALPVLGGVTGELGLRGRFGGVSLLGVSFGQSDASVPYNGSVQDPSGGVSTQPVTCSIVSARLLQPQLQLLLWRFSLGVQGGVGLRYVTFYVGSDKTLESSPQQVEPLVEGQGRLRFTVVGGLYLEGAVRYAQPFLLSHFTDGEKRFNSSQLSYQVGAGYAF